MVKFIYKKTHVRTKVAHNWTNSRSKALDGQAETTEPVLGSLQTGRQVLRRETTCRGEEVTIKRYSFTLKGLRIQTMRQLKSFRPMVPIS